MKRYYVVFGTNGMPDGSTVTSASSKKEAESKINSLCSEYGQQVISVKKQ